jgi:hypothetical protein
MSIKLNGGYTRESIKTSHLGTTTAHTFIPSSLYDAGGCTIEFQTDEAITYSAYAVDQTPGALTITFASGLVFTTTAFVESMDFGADLEQLQTGTVTFKFTAAMTHT